MITLITQILVLGGNRTLMEWNDLCLGTQNRSLIDQQTRYTIILLILQLSPLNEPF